MSIMNPLGNIKARLSNNLLARIFGILIVFLLPYPADAAIVDDPREKILGADILMNHYLEGWGHKHQYKGCLTEVFFIRIDIDTDTVTGKKSENRHMDIDVERFEKRERRLKSS